ncbi:hypothetical protein [Roseomonas sp. BN140053]|uniref:hypothetical protein n=1 Tax=Roseomonas sp. BN140053 TaxID=3391898 RepID=UPI0039EAA0D3
MASPRLMGLEALAMTQALREGCVLALSVHASLVVPASAPERAATAIRAGYVTPCGVCPNVKAERQAQKAPSVQVQPDRDLALDPV